FLTLGSKFLGFIRETLIAAKFGAGIKTDTFSIAMTVTGLVTGLISTAVKTAFVPVLSEVEAREGKEGKIAYINNMIYIVFFLAVVLVILGWLGTPFLVRLVAKGFRGQQYILAVKLTRIRMPMLIFSGIVGAISGFLQSEERHTSTAAIGFPYNLVFICFFWQLILVSAG
ncbi:MAG: DUF2837 family protein, partial [Firmicutes bacterium]|nr:DUF2837 family protein [Bacillota bacterium]